MLHRFTRFLLFCLLMLSVHAATAQSKPAYQYMQLFYYGAKTISGPIGHFSPAMRGQTDIVLATPTAYMKFLTARMTDNPGSDATRQVVVSSSAGFVDLTKMTPTQRRQYEEQERKQQQQQNKEQLENMEKFARMNVNHTQDLTSQITQSLNTAAADGWELTQMSSYGTDGLVYLLRKAR